MLGFGCMRFPRKGSSIDIDASEKLVRYAVDHGMNYFDTAYIYPGSEKAVGEIFKRIGCREQIQIATKMPHYLIRNLDQLEKVFQEQLDRLQTDYIDNYLMHMLPDVEIWNKMINMGVLDWLKAKKASGAIRKIGFSYHGNTENFIRLIDAYDWEFCQVQYNYLDEHSQAGRRGVEYAASKGIPVVIMEPLRGGKLVDLPADALEAMKKTGMDRSPAEWGLRWLWDQGTVSCVLSGMNTMEMLQENIRIAEDTKVGALTEADFAMYDQVKAAINACTKVPCTGCGYCQPCPFGVDIPGSFRCHNATYIDGYFNGFREYIMCTAFKVKPTNASLCRQCGKCEQHCPQNIEIRKELKQVVRHMENPIFKLALLVSRLVFKEKKKKKKKNNRKDR